MAQTFKTPADQAADMTKPIKLKIQKPAKTKIDRDAYINRLMSDKDRSYNDEGLYNDDEIREMAGYVFDDYGFGKMHEEDWNDPKYTGYDEFRDHFLDNFGNLHYGRGSRGLPWKYPSGWDKLDVETKNNAIDYYLEGYYNQKNPDRKYGKKIRDEVYKNIDDYYQAKHGRAYTGSEADHWRERILDLAARYPDNAYVKNLALIAKDVNGVDHQDLIEDLIKTLGFGNSYERRY